MKSGIKTLLILFFVVLAVYLAGFYGIEHLRHRQGPWRVLFVADEHGTPAIEISQPALDIDSVSVVFQGETAGVSNLSDTVVFDVPRKPVPFGEVLFEDLTFLPGAVTFNFFGHEVELLPRVLVVNRQPVKWESHTAIELEATNKVAAR
jgi:hypothetical protein